MPVSLRRTAEEQPQAPLLKAPQKDITDIVVRMVIGLLINYVTRKLRSRSDSVKTRKEAARKVEKLAKKGKEIPPDLQKDAVAGMSRHQKKKAAEVAKKAAAKKGKKGKKKKGHKLIWLLALIVIGALVAKAASAKKP